MHRTTAFALVIVGSLFSRPAAAQDVPRPPRTAPAHMKVPDGFRVSLFAGEPDVVQPIALTFDDRGRLWVAECYSYPKWLADPKAGRDRILIFEDTNGDGTFDRRTVFHDRLANVSGLVYGHGGVWVCATPNLLFIPDRDGDDRPDGPPQVVLDGWDLKARHNVFNGLIWGPDGWLYGCNGILSNSKVGRPGAPDKERVALNCGVWRYHPAHKTFELVASGTTNPWGLDFDDHGQMFITNCVIHHLWHVVPNAHFQRMFGQDLNPHVYGLLNSVADHIHWGGGHWTTSRGGQGSHSDAGGGHAHSGAMIYLGDNWPAAYRNGAFMCNIHGSRINHDTLDRQGSTYRARHAADVLHANDPWFRGLALQYGPDGGVYVLDWTDTGECHNYEVADQKNGRVYKVTYGTSKHRPEDLAKLSDLELVRRQLHPNDWHVRTARRLLAERKAAGKLDRAVVPALWKLHAQEKAETRRLRLIWALHAAGGLTDDNRRDLMAKGTEHERAWAVRLAMDRSPTDDSCDACARLAKADPSPVVRLALASHLPRIRLSPQSPTEYYWPAARGLVSRAEDANDPYLPLMVWYGVEREVAADPAEALKLLAACRLPIVREYIARRLASLPAAAEHLGPLVAHAHQPKDAEVQRDVLRGIQEALHGQRKVAMPEAWVTAYPALSVSPSPEVRERSLALAVQFGDARALKQLHDLVADRKEPAERRASALATLLGRGGPALLPVMHGLLDDPAVRGPALRGLAAFDDPGTPALILKRYAGWDADARADAIQTLASRPAYALALLDAVERKEVPRRDLGAFTIRQLQALKDAKVRDRLREVWGEVRPPSAVRAEQMKRYQAALTADVLRQADLANGRRLYAKTCAACHRLFDDGGAIGPELTGSQRANLDYVLENVLDPSAVVPRDYQVNIITTAAGRVVTGVVKRETDRALVVQTQNELLTLPKEEIEARTLSPLSMMPEGLLNDLRLEDVRDLVGYLASPTQVPAARAAAEPN